MVDRIQDLETDYAAAETVKQRLEISSEIRLSDGLLQRLLAQVSTAAPQPEALISIKNRRAANVRWARERAQYAGA